MKGPLDRTKVVLRHLPPTISQDSLLEQLDSRFAGRYNWVSFRPCKRSQKQISYSRAYINFNRPADVIEFAEFFDGHVFVNEKGMQFKAIVEYAPSQRVPKQSSKKDGRDGTILKDPEYLEFLEFLAKPVENLPSAEIQLERKEAERAGAPKDIPIVTPLMDYVRQKRAAKSGARRPVANGKPTRRVAGGSTVSPGSGTSKRASEKRRTSTMYVLRDSTSKGRSGKDKSTYVVVSKRDGQQALGKSVTSVPASGDDSGADERGGAKPAETGKKKILLLKGKEKEIPIVTDSPSLEQNTTSVRNSSSSTVAKQNHRREASGKIIRSILLNKDSRHNQSSSAAQTEQQFQTDRDKRLPRPPSGSTFHKDTNGPSEEKRARNRDRPDRGVWTPLRRSDGSHASDESLSSSSSQPNQILDSVEGASGEMKGDSPSGRGGVPTGRNSHSADKCSYKHSGRRGSAFNVKDLEGPEGKPLKRGGSSAYGSHESHVQKQVWVQKSTSGS